jgi:oxygen-independent coproporphyrinogen-3 oxidase
MQPSLAVYLHIPFCRTKCTYCAFNTYINLDTLIEPFVYALVREIEIVAASRPDLPVATIFLGGGTPSLLSPIQIQRVLNAVRDGFDVNPDAEISVEANPNDVHPEYMEELIAVGVNRLSIGMQSANDNELRLFARRHDNDQVARAVSAARRAGFNNINLDLIYGVPHQTIRDWQWSLNQALMLQPDHISLYALGLEDGTAMKAWVDTGRLPDPDDDLSADMYELATDYLAADGYDQYEISNWAKPGYMCRHNLQYWRNWPYIGLGPGAHGYAGGVRYSTILSPQRYIRLMQTAQRLFDFPYTPATDNAIMVDRAGEISETLIMGLRLTREGISRSRFTERFGEDLLTIYPETIERFSQFGLLTVDGETVRLTRQGRLLSNVLFRELV